MNGQKLWECKHPYYCKEGNFFMPGLHETYSSWEEFTQSESGLDLDLNLLFRWDLIPPRDYDDHLRFEYAENYPELTFLAFFMTQRKGYNRSAEVKCARSDEPKIREWLKPRWEKMQQLWEPFSTSEESVETVK